MGFAWKARAGGAAAAPGGWRERSQPSEYATVAGSCPGGACHPLRAGAAQNAAGLGGILARSRRHLGARFVGGAHVAVKVEYLPSVDNEPLTVHALSATRMRLEEQLRAHADACA